MNLTRYKAKLISNICHCDADYDLMLQLIDNNLRLNKSLIFQFCNCHLVLFIGFSHAKRYLVLLGLESSKNELDAKKCIFI